MDQDMSYNHYTKQLYKIRPSPNGLAQIVLFVISACGYISLQIKRKQLKSQIAPVDDGIGNNFNNQNVNKPVMSTGQLMMNGK